MIRKCAKDIQAIFFNSTSPIRIATYSRTRATRSRITNSPFKQMKVMNKILLAIALIAVGCASQKGATTTTAGRGDTRTAPVENIDDNIYLLQEISKDKSYGFEKSNPVKVRGSSENSGPKNERRFLNALLGPNGEEIRYYRAGSCCPFKTPNGLIDNTGMLDAYKVSWAGSPDTLTIYINIYDEGDLKIPVGFTAKKKR